MPTAIKILWSMAAGALVGVVVTSLITPNVLAWYNTAGTVNQALCSCSDLTREVTWDLLRAQMIGAFVGALAALVLYVWLHRKKSAQAETSPEKKP